MASFVSYKENETRAGKLFILFLPDTIIAFAFVYFDYPYKFEIVWIIVSLYWTIAAVLIPNASLAHPFAFFRMLALELDDVLTY